MTDPLLDTDVRRTWVALIDTAQAVATPCRTSDPDLWHADTLEDRRREPRAPQDQDRRGAPYTETPPQPRTFGEGE